MTITGDYTQLNGGTLEIAIAGINVADFDHLNVGGRVSLASGAILELDFIDGFAPKTGDTFHFLSYSSLDPANGLFGSIEITGLASGFNYLVTPDPMDPTSYQLLALNDGVATSVPEPSALVLAVFAGALLSGTRYFRRRG